MYRIYLVNCVFKQDLDNVYFVFFVNKFGEYFGYVCMIFFINDDFVVVIEFVFKVQFLVDVDFFKVIVIEVIEFVFKGWIIDDFVCGIIFWEVDCGDQMFDGG